MKIVAKSILKTEKMKRNKYVLLLLLFWLSGIAVCQDYVSEAFAENVMEAEFEYLHFNVSSIAAEEQNMLRGWISGTGEDDIKTGAGQNDDQAYNDAPIDGGMLFLLLLVVIYAWWKVRKSDFRDEEDSFD